MNTPHRIASWRKWLNLKPQHPYVIACIGFGFAIVLFVFIIPIDIETYKAIRGSLFTGFFTVAGFLLSAKTLVILNMKKEVYEKDYYLAQIHMADWTRTEHTKKMNKSPRSECFGSQVYQPLAQIGTLLSVNILLALVTAFSQITLGLLECKACIVLCLSFSLATAILLACSVWLMWLNFQSLYEDWERLAQIKLEEKWSKSIEDFHAGIVKPAEGELPIVPTVPPGDKISE